MCSLASLLVGVYLIFLCPQTLFHTHIGVGLCDVKIVLVLKSSTVKTCFSVGRTCPISGTWRGGLGLEYENFNLQII